MADLTLQDINNFLRQQTVPWQNVPNEQFNSGNVNNDTLFHNEVQQMFTKIK